jgi:succinate dehydrogenase/fumarate reductase flavoprotein subunit
MCVKHDQRIDPKVRSTGSKGVTGNLLIAAQDIGADTVNMDFIQIRMDQSAVAYHHKVLAEKDGTYIDVDFHGNRFWKEMSDIVAYRNARLTLVHTKNLLKWYAISDSEGIKANNKNEREIKKHLKLKTAFRADTLEGLAQIINVPSKHLIETIDRYNAFVAKGKDEDFGQHSSYLKWKIAVPPFFAMPKTYYIQHTLGGVCINEKAQVVDRNGKIIPKLYAAGEFVGGIHGIERDSGGGITECIVFGRIAGKYAASNNRKV